METFLAIIIVLMHYINIISSATNCSAINAYVQITSPSNLSATLTSSQALFAPYSYYIPSTQLVALDAINDDICAEDGVSTDISNKIVLIFESNGDCSSHYKVYVAQQNNAIGVVLANNDNSGLVINIVDDNDLQDKITTIPMRSISLMDGQILNNAILSGSTVMIEFGCFSSDYPTHICILDTRGDYWYLDGEYQRQELTYNGHPIYKKEGYVYLLSNMYIFQHNGNGDTDWYWAITLDSNFLDERDIRAKCSIGNIYEPSLCPLWNTTNRFKDNFDNMIAFSSYHSLNISRGLCSMSDAYLCITSQQSNLDGLSGTYRQFNMHVPYWFRELDVCDTRPGFFTFTNGDFVLYDSLNSWSIATCSLHSTFDTQWEWAKLIPNYCKEWHTIINNTLIEQLAIDATFSIKMDSKCEDITPSNCNASIIAPDTLCMDKSSVMHGFLEGEYIRSVSVIGPLYGTPQYERADELYYDNELVHVYMWWFGEIDADRYSWWVLSESNLSTAIELNGYVNIYGYCESKTNNPIHCNAAWKFYFVNAFHSDYNFKVHAGDCNIGQANEEYTWPTYICINNSGTDNSIIQNDLFIGGYEINETSINNNGLTNGYPHWIKPKNERYTNSEIYLYFDGFFGYWQIGRGLNVEEGSVLICFQETDYSPIDCKQWYDIDLISMDNMYVYQCNEHDIDRLPLVDNNENQSTNVGEIVGIVLVILFCVCCIAILYWFYQKNTINIKQRISDADKNNNTEMIAVDGTDIDGIRTDSNAGLTINAVQPMKKADFELINAAETPVNATETPDGSLADTTNDNKESNDDDEEEESEEENDDESQIEDDDEKKDEDEKGIDSRRMSQQMVKAMQNDLDEWTNALINDPSSASRRYSRHSQTDEKFVVDVMSNKKLEKKNKEKEKENKNENENDKKESFDPLDENKDNVEKENKKEVVEMDENNNISDENDENNNDNDKPPEWTQF